MDKNEMIAAAEQAQKQGVECWISWQNRAEELQLPVTPFWMLDKPKNNQTVNLYDVGDINMPGNRGLRSFDLESFFPHAGHNYSFCRTNTGDPYLFCRMLDKWQESGFPVRVIFTNTTINIALMIENFQYGEQDGTGDVYYKLSFREHRFLDDEEVSTAGSVTFESAIPKKQAEAKEWTLTYGDTLTGISIAKWGDETHVEELIKLNKDLIKDPNSLKAIAGQVLQLE